MKTTNKRRDAENAEKTFLLKIFATLCALCASAFPGQAQTPVTLSTVNVYAQVSSATVTFTPVQQIGVSYPNYVLGAPVSVIPTNGSITTNLLEGIYVESFTGLTASKRVYVPGLWVTNFGYALPINLAASPWLLGAGITQIMITNQASAVTPGTVSNALNQATLASFGTVTNNQPGIINLATNGTLTVSNLSAATIFGAMATTANLAPAYGSIASSVITQIGNIITGLHLGNASTSDTNAMSIGGNAATATLATNALAAQIAFNAGLSTNAFRAAYLWPQEADWIGDSLICLLMPNSLFATPGGFNNTNAFFFTNYPVIGNFIIYSNTSGFVPILNNSNASLPLAVSQILLQKYGVSMTADASLAVPGVGAANDDIGYSAAIAENGVAVQPNSAPQSAYQPPSYQVGTILPASYQYIHNISTLNTGRRKIVPIMIGGNDLGSGIITNASKVINTYNINLAMARNALQEGDVPIFITYPHAPGHYINPSSPLTSVWSFQGTNLAILDNLERTNQFNIPVCDLDAAMAPFYVYPSNYLDSVTHGSSNCIVAIEAPFIANWIFTNLANLQNYGSAWTAMVINNYPSQNSFTATNTTTLAPIITFSNLMAFGTYRLTVQYVYLQSNTSGTGEQWDLVATSGLYDFATYESFFFPSLSAAMYEWSDNAGVSLVGGAGLSGGAQSNGTGTQNLLFYLASTFHVGQTNANINFSVAPCGANTGKVTIRNPQFILEYLK